jgi:putative SOS response-associated peptidase YedK
MCGRYSVFSPLWALEERFATDETLGEEIGASWNVAPTDESYVVANRHGKRRLRALRWGLVPSWEKDKRDAARRINARAETVATKPAFAAAFARRRCLVPADGFYEWRRTPDGGRHPIHIHPVNGEPMAFAGLWEAWRDPTTTDAPLLRTFTIITVAANQTVSPIHNRMPAILPRAAWSKWLEPDETDPARLQRLLAPAGDDLLAMRPVRPLVNNVRNNGPELIAPAETGAASLFS